MTVINATQARSNLFNLLESVLANNDTAKISTKTGNVVLMSENEYNSIVETMYLTSIPNMKQSILEGGRTPISDCVTIDEL